MRLHVLAAALLVGMLSGTDIAAAAFTCPDTPTIQAAITKYINVDYWTPAQRETWKVKSVSDFKFGPIRTGQITKRQVDYGPARDICPVAVEYSFVVEKNDGRRETTGMGANKTHLFYLDDFKNWLFKIS